MGNYISSSLLEERIGSTLLGQLMKVTGTDKTTAITNIINRAEGVVDGYLSGRYTVPVTANGLVEDIALAFAVYNCFKACGSSWDEVPKKHQEAYTEAKGMLNDISKGICGLPVDSTADEDNIPIVVSDTDERYPDSTMTGF